MNIFNNLGNSTQTDLQTLTYMMTEIPKEILFMICVEFFDNNYSNDNIDNNTRPRIIELIKNSDINNDKKLLIMDNLKNIPNTNKIRLPNF